MSSAATSVVAVVRARPETVLEDVARACRLAGMAEALPAGAPVILKDNISWHLPYPGANTTPWQLEGVIRALAAAGRGPLLAMHNDTVVTNPRAGLANLKLQPVYEAYGIEQRFANEPESVAWVEWRPQARTPWLDRVYPEGLSVPAPFRGAGIVHLPTLKTHVYTTTTGAVKNAFGGLLNTRRHYCHTWIHGVLADLMAVQKELHAGIFALADGTICGTGPGPRTLQPVEKGLILASADCVALDAASARFMGFDPWRIGYLRECGERGLGAVDAADIELAGDPEPGGWGFRVGDNLVSRAGDILWFGALRRAQRLFFHTPLVHLFIGASHGYHDLWWWNVHGRRRARRVREQSEWGRLFARYQPEAGSVP